MAAHTFACPSLPSCESWTRLQDCVVGAVIVHVQSIQYHGKGSHHAVQFHSSLLSIIPLPQFLCSLSNSNVIEKFEGVNVLASPKQCQVQELGMNVDNRTLVYLYNSESCLSQPASRRHLSTCAGGDPCGAALGRQLSLTVVISFILAFAHLVGAGVAALAYRKEIQHLFLLSDDLAAAGEKPEQSQQTWRP